MEHVAQPPSHCTFDAADWRLMARYWHPIARASDISETPIPATLLDEPLVIYKLGDEITVARDVCPHRGAPLSLGTNEGHGIVCRYHRHRYGSDGRCNRIPSRPHDAIPSAMRLRIYPSTERYGLIWTRLVSSVSINEDAESLYPLPAMPFWDDIAFQQIVCPPFDVTAFAGRQVEGFLDVAHFGWLHGGTFGDPNDVEVPDYSTLETAHGFSADYRSLVGNYPIGTEAFGKPGFVWLRRFDVHLPFTATLTIHFPNDAKLVIMNAASPVSARKTRLFAPIARNFDQDIPIGDAYAFNLRIFAEDRLAVETQRPPWLPLDLNAEGHTPADRSSIAYRMGLQRHGFSHAFGAKHARSPATASTDGDS